MEAVQLLEAKGAYSIKDYDELKTLLDRFRTDEAVSYTHLDVYKRQPLSCT